MIISKVMDIDELTLRFPQISELIFNQLLDDQNLVKCRLVCKSWKEYIDGQKFIWFRIIHGSHCYKWGGSKFDYLPNTNILKGKATSGRCRYTG